MNSGLFSLPLAAVAEPPPVVRAAREGDSSDSKFERAARHPRTFFAGEENALVRSLAAAATSVPPAYNPIVLCGASGVGKTSVAHALAALRQKALDLKNVVLTTGSDLLRDLADAIDSDSAADFRRRFHRADLVLVDEVHRLAGKPAAQQFLVSALDVLQSRGVAAIITSLRLPTLTEGLVPALRSRLSGGLVVTLAPPGPAARLQIVRRAAEDAALSLSEASLARLAQFDAAPLAAATVKSLLTAPRLQRAVMEQALLGDAAPAEAGLTPPDEKRSMRDAALAVARQSGLTLAALKGKSRQQHIADARALAMYAARRLTGATYAQIGRFFGGRDHSTVLHACQKTESRLTKDDAARRSFEDLLRHIDR